MKYQLVIDEEPSRIFAAMDETTHELFVLAALDLPRDPHGLGYAINSEGPFTRRGYTLGGMGMLVYVVNDTTMTVTIADVIWLG